MKRGNNKNFVGMLFLIFLTGCILKSEKKELKIEFGVYENRGMGEHCSYDGVTEICDSVVTITQIEFKENGQVEIRDWFDGRFISLILANFKIDGDQLRFSNVKEYFTQGCNNADECAMLAEAKEKGVPDPNYIKIMPSFSVKIKIINKNDIIFLDENNSEVVFNQVG